MPLEDFSKKQKDKFRKVLEKWLSELPELNDPDEFRRGSEEINSALKHAIGLDLEELTLIPVESFAPSVDEKDSLNDENLERLANLLLTLGLENRRRDIAWDEAERLLERGLAVLKYLERKSATYSFERNAMIDRITAVLASDRSK